jgi:hypothetical protein
MARAVALALENVPAADFATSKWIAKKLALLWGKALWLDGSTKGTNVLTPRAY